MENLPAKKVRKAVSSIRLFLVILKLSFVFYPFVCKWTDVNFVLNHFSVADNSREVR